MKALSLKGKGFKGSLKGAEIVVHRRWAKCRNAKVFRGETVSKVAQPAPPQPNSEVEILDGPNSKLELLARLGPNPKLELLARLGPNPKLELLARLGLNPKLELLARLGLNPKLELLARLGPNPKLELLARLGPTFLSAVSRLNIRYPKFSLHPLKVALCRTLLINARRRRYS